LTEHNLNEIKTHLHDYFNHGVFQLKEARNNIPNYNRSINYKLVQSGFLEIARVNRSPAKTKTYYRVNKNHVVESSV
jgi:hypothetical protein